MYDYVIIGAGFAGAVSANLLATHHNKKILVIEKRAHIGGNCYDEVDENGIIVHRYGPHLFHTSSKEVWEYLSRFTEWTPYEHNVLAHIKGKNVPIPFNFNTIEALFAPLDATRFQQKLLHYYALNTKVPILDLKKHFDDDLRMLADFIYENLFLHYTAKQWGLSPQEIDSTVTARVPIFIGRDNRYFNDTFQAIPNNGYTKLFEALLDHPNITVELQKDFLNEVCWCENRIGFRNDFTCKILYTGAVDALFDYCFDELPYRTTEMVFETIDQAYFQEAATINYPNDHDYTRITEFKHIHPILSPKTTILKEYPKEHRKEITVPYYPIFNDKNQAQYTQYMQKAQHFSNLTLIGRLAEYRYYDMDDIVLHALNTVGNV